MQRQPTLTRTVRIILIAAVVCLIPLQAQTTAKLIKQEGRVSVMRGGAVALSVNDVVKGTETIVTGPDGYALFQIADGSTFEVFQNSQVVFQKTYNPMDILDVFLGKVRVLIDHSRGPNHKRVVTPTALISVRGTVFNVTVEDADGTTLVSVEEGLVGVSHRLQVNGDEVLLHPTEWLRVFPNQRLAKAPGNNPAGKVFVDAIKRAGVDWATTNPGGSGGGIPGTPGGGPGGNGDNGKKKGTGPGGAPPPAGGK